MKARLPRLLHDIYLMISIIYFFIYEVEDPHEMSEGACRTVT